MALQELYEAYIGESEWWKKVAGACMIAADNIANESPSTPNHANRIQWAILVRDNPKAMAKEMLKDVIRDENIIGNVEGATDETIQSVVDGLVDDYATG